MASSAEKLDYDDMLLNILQREGNVDNFLDVFFGFLNRNTDFFRIMADPTASFGFPPGIARQKVFNTFKAFEETSFAANPADRQAVQASICCARRRTDQRQMPPPSTKPKKSASNEKVTPKKSPVKKSSSDTSCASSTPITDSSSTSSSSTASQSTKDGSEASSPSEPETQAEAPPANNEVEVSEFQNNPDSYNGAVREKFSWSQNITEVDLRVFVEKDIRKGKQVKVDIKEQSVKVAVLKDGKFETVVEGDLKWKVHPTKSMWTMVPGDHIHVSLEKAQERWWEACFEGFNERKGFNEQKEQNKMAEGECLCKTATTTKTTKQQQQQVRTLSPSGLLTALDQWKIWIKSLWPL